jgi:hypothetical protein
MVFFSRVLACLRVGLDFADIRQTFGDRRPFEVVGGDCE